MVTSRTKNVSRGSGSTGPLSGSSLGDRYTVEDLIASGTGGHVYVAFDRTLMRRVAVKILHEQCSSFDHRQRFLVEARRVSAVDHPNIPSIHDIGTTEDGAPYFTMTLLRGRGLHEILDALREDESRRDEWTLVRLVQVLQQVARTLHYVHQRGLIHRDLKPANIGVGDDGEVYVLDWGLAKRFTADPDAASPYASIHVTETLHGAVKGTPLYMAPEQARGELDRLDPRTDVFALGAILYEMICLRPPYAASRSLHEVVRAARLGEIPSLACAAPKGDLPPDLDSLTQRAMALDPADRPQSGHAFADELQGFLEGARSRDRRHGHVRTFLSNALSQLSKARHHDEKALGLCREAGEKRSLLDTWAPIEKKIEIWELEDECERLGIESAREFAHALDLTSRAVAHDPTNANARELMARLYYERLRKAITGRRWTDAAWLERMVEIYNDGPLDHLVRASGHALIESEPSGAEVTLVSQRSVHRRWVDHETRSLGVAPLAADAIPRGRHIIELRSPGSLAARFPVHVVPGTHLSLHANLVPEADAPPGFVLVPGGTFLSGPRGHEEELDLPPFLIAQHPTTLEEYAEWLDVLATIDPSYAERHVPHVPGQGALLKRIGGSYEFRPATNTAIDPIPYSCGLPTVGVSAESADAFAVWRGERLGHAVHLPTELQWEKAARGTDGRLYPWGDAFEALYCRTAESIGNATAVPDVCSAAEDVSAYGVHDLAGGVREWCRDEDPGSAISRPVRGGSWNCPRAQSELSARSLVAYDTRSASIGFRLVIEL